MMLRWRSLAIADSQLFACDFTAAVVVWWFYVSFLEGGGGLYAAGRTRFFVRAGVVYDRDDGVWFVCRKTEE